MGRIWNQLIYSIAWRSTVQKKFSKKKKIQSARLTFVSWIRFTHPEQIDKFKCQGCHSSVPGTKQLTFKKLPVVISFHMKRFKQTLYSASSIKIERYVSFPDTLDLSPFRSDPTTEAGGTGQGATESKEAIYDLFCVVNHHGKIDNGHYTCFVNHSGYWYLCDDHRILRASEYQVKTSTAYDLNFEGWWKVLTALLVQILVILCEKRCTYAVKVK